MIHLIKISVFSLTTKHLVIKNKNNLVIVTTLSDIRTNKRKSLNNDPKQSRKLKFNECTNDSLNNSNQDTTTKKCNSVVQFKHLQQNNSDNIPSGRVEDF